MFYFMSSLVTWDVVILVLIILKIMFGYMTFNVKNYILSQIFYKRNGWLSCSYQALKIGLCKKLSFGILKAASWLYDFDLTWPLLYELN